MKSLFLNILLLCYSNILIYAQNFKPQIHTQKQTTILRIGFFPNLTHPQALVAQALTRKGEGWFERYLPDDISIEWRRFNAGPSSMESLITGVIDLSYVGPSPALNLYTKTLGKDIRLLSGAVKGGSGLVLQGDILIKDALDWKNRKIATPQFGNTQDIACRNWFAKQAIKDIKLLPTSNPDQLMLFRRKQIDGAWTIEPWLSRLINEGNGKLFFSDNDQWTTLLVGSQAFCDRYKTIKEVLIKAHEALTAWIKNNNKQAAVLMQSELKEQTHLNFSIELIETTLAKLQLCTSAQKEEIQKWLDDAINIGFVKSEKNISLDMFFSETLPVVQGKEPVKIAEELKKETPSATR